MTCSRIAVSLLPFLLLADCAHQSDGVTPATSEVTTQGLITLDMEAAHVCDVFFEMARKSGDNLVYGGPWSRLVTVSFKDVPWRSAVEAVAKSCDLIVDWGTPGMVLVTER